MPSDENLFENNPRDYAMALFESYGMSAEQVALILLKAMSHDDIREALDANGLSPRFDEEEE